MYTRFLDWGTPKSLSLIHISQLTDRKLTECFVVAVFLRDDVLIHVVGGVAHDLPDAVGFDFKFHRVGSDVYKRQ